MRRNMGKVICNSGQIGRGSCDPLSNPLSITPPPPVALFSRRSSPRCRLRTVIKEHRLDFSAKEPLGHTKENATVLAHAQLHAVRLILGA